MNMTGREAILFYLSEHKTMTTEEVAKSVGVTIKAVRTAQWRMLATGELVVSEKSDNTQIHALASGVPGYKPDSGNDVFNECRQNWQGYNIHKVFGGARQLLNGEVK